MYPPKTAKRILTNNETRLKSGFCALLGMIWLLSACSPSVTLLPTETVLPKQFLSAGKASVEGVVIGGGDKSPSTRLGGPRTYVFEVRSDRGEIILVTYVAMPPSPAADRQAFRLEFHAGEIKIGDYLKAYGSFDPATMTLTVTEHRDYIETYPSRP